MEVLTRLSSYFWSPTFWLPQGYEWEDFHYKTTTNWIHLWPDYDDLLYPILLTLILVVLKQFFERFIFVKFGQRLGVRSNQYPPPPQNFILESCYEANNGRSPTRPEDFNKLTNITGMDRRTLEHWYTQRTLWARPTNLARFAQSLWIGTCHLFTFSIGVRILWSKPWFWKLEECWIDFPEHEVPEDIQLYYLVGISVYLSLLQGAKRQNFWPEVIHDVARLALLALTWYSKLCRIGSIIFFLHDSANLPLYFAKAAYYAEEKRNLITVLFPWLLITWILCRLYFLPFSIIKSITLEAPEHFETFPSFALIAFLVNVLLCLDVYWTWHLARVVREYYTAAGEVETPVDNSRRSSTESSESNSRTEVDEFEEAEQGISDEDDSTGTLHADSSSSDSNSDW